MLKWKLACEVGVQVLPTWLTVWSLLQVLFVCTANVVEMIPNPLLDRMEVIAIAGYITDEKVHIARDYLEKATREACGIKPEQVSLSLSLTHCSILTKGSHEKCIIPINFRSK